MKNYIERYIHAVTKRLPEPSRIDVKEELHSLIYTMLPDQPTESEIETVLHSLGSPMALAYQYQDEKRYLISPPFFHDYLNTLKIVASIIVSLQVLNGAIDSIFNLEATSFWPFVGEVVDNMLGGLLGNLAIGYAIVTIVFWAYEVGVQKGEVQWAMKDLPEVPRAKSKKIHRFETSVELIFHVVFSIIAINVFINYLDLLQITTDEGMRIPLLNPTVVNAFIPYFILAAVFGFIVIVTKLYLAEWRYSLTVMHTVYELMSTLITILFLQATNLIPVDLLRFIASTMDVSFATLQQNVSTGINIITGIMILVVGIELFFTWKKTKEGYLAS